MARAVRSPWIETRSLLKEERDDGVAVEGGVTAE